MTTSGSANYTISALEIITEAYEICGIYDPGNSLAPEEVASASRKLNLLVKSWMKDYHLWAMSEATLFFSLDTLTYSLGRTGTHCTNSYIHTTLSSNAASSATILSLTSTSGMSNSDNIGIVLDSGAIHWTTISNVSGTTIASGLSGAASSGNVVFSYTTKIERPLRIISAYRRSITDTDTPVDIISRQEYADLSDKFTEGKTIQVFYQPTLTTGTLSIWPTADLTTDVLRFWYERPLEDFDAYTDNPDFPIEWGEALCYNLAYRVAMAHDSVPQPKRLEIKDAAQVFWYDALGHDKEDASIYFQPNLRNA